MLFLLKWPDVNEYILGRKGVLEMVWPREDLRVKGAITRFISWDKVKDDLILPKGLTNGRT